MMSRYSAPLAFALAWFTAGAMPAYQSYVIRYMYVAV
jgi:hypothetical protein